MSNLFEVYWATKFGNYGYLKHYQKHVLQKGERFNSHNPKFPYMSEQTYIKEAKKLSEQPADKVDSNSSIIGFVIQKDSDGDRKIIKIRKPSKWNPKYVDVVIKRWRKTHRLTCGSSQV